MKIIPPSFLKRLSKDKKRRFEILKDFEFSHKKYKKGDIVSRHIADKILRRSEGSYAKRRNRIVESYTNPELKKKLERETIIRARRKKQNLNKKRKAINLRVADSVGIQLRRKKTTKGLVVKLPFDQEDFVNSSSLITDTIIRARKTKKFSRYIVYFETKTDQGEKFLYGDSFEYKMRDISDDWDLNDTYAVVSPENLQKNLVIISSDKAIVSKVLRTYIHFSYK